MGNLGPLEIGGILLLFVLLFGAKKLPDLGSSVGKSIRNFKKGLNEAKHEDEEVVVEDATTTTASSQPEAKVPGKP